MPRSPAAAIAANRYGLGARPAELAGIGSDPKAWLTAQFAGRYRAPPELAGLAGSREVLAEFLTARADRRAAKAEPDVVKRLVATLRERMLPHYTAQAAARTRIALTSEVGFRERLVHFWSNHFAVSIDKPICLGTAGTLESEAIRPNVGGRFAAVISGWSIGGGQGRNAEGEPGAFRFRAALHEPGPITVLGRRYGEGGFEQGRAVLTDLARKPATARHLATKLARHFAGDEPPPALIDRLARAYTASDGDLPSVYAALIDWEDAFQPSPVKFKTPAEFAISALRALERVPQEPKALLSPFEFLGQRHWSPGSPAGWPDRAQDWDGADALMKRIEWSVAVAARVGESQSAPETASAVLGESLGEHTQAALAHAASGSQALALMLMSPEFQRR